DLHLKIIEERLRRREKVEVLTHPPKIPYRETVNGVHEGMYRHKKQSGGAGAVGARPHPAAELPPRGHMGGDRTQNPSSSMRSFHYHPEINYVFIDRVSGGSVPNQFIPAVQKGVLERIEKGVLAGYQVQDVCVELFFGKDHPVDSNENAFRTAGSMCFKQE